MVFGPYPEVRSALQDLSSGTTRQKKIWRLMTHWSDLDLAHLPPEQRRAQEREMAIVYETFDEKGLDAALAIIEHEAPAKVEPSDEKTLEEQEQMQEQIVMQVRRRLSMGQAVKGVDSHATKHRSGRHTGTEEPQLPAATPSRAVAQLLSMKAQYEQCGRGRMRKSADTSGSSPAIKRPSRSASYTSGLPS